jgi:hypothetical protein
LIPVLVAGALVASLGVVALFVALDRARHPVRCGFGPIPASTVPEIADTTLAVTRLEEPEGCGASYSRDAVLVAETDEEPDALLTRAVTELERAGWVRRECVTEFERCFARGRYFLAATTPEGARNEAVPWAYPRELPADRAQLLLSIEDLPRSASDVRRKPAS